MSLVDRLLAHAVETNADPKVVSPSGTCYAWRPMWGWDHVTRQHRTLFHEKVIWFKPLGLFYEYSTYAGSEEEHHDKHGKYSWQMDKKEA